jgi:hypothetical protein
MTAMLTPQAFKYLGAIYEEAIDARMNLLEIQQHLSRRGIHKPMLAIKHDINNVFVFPGYVERHPAPPRQTQADIDREIGRKPLVSRLQSNRQTVN